MNWWPCTVSVSPIMRSDACWRVMAMDVWTGWRSGVRFRTCVGHVMYTRKFDLLPGIYLEPSTKPQANLIREHTYTHRPASRSKRARCAYQRRLGGGGPFQLLKKVNCKFFVLLFIHVIWSIHILSDLFIKKKKTVLRVCS